MPEPLVRAQSVLANLPLVKDVTLLPSYIKQPLSLANITPNEVLMDLRDLML